MGALHFALVVAIVGILGLAGSALVATPARALIFSFEDAAVPVGDNPQGFSITHCDLDGLPDVVAAGFDADTASLFVNDGFGRLLHQATVPTPPQPGGAACADFTGDGLGDFAVSSWANGTVTIYAAEETGGYTEIDTIEVGTQPRAVTSADINLDGKADLLVVNSGSSDITLLFGNGAGGFPTVADIRLPSENQNNRPRAAAVADFDQDGFPDIAVASQGSPSLRLLLGDGLGFHFFSPEANLPHAGRLIGMAAADYNDDDIPDLALLSAESAGDSAVSLYIGDGDGTFTFDTRIPVREASKAVGLADFDGDGLVDLALSYSDANAVQVVRALGNGRFPGCGIGEGQPFQCPISPSINEIGNAQLRIQDETNQLIFVDSDARSIQLLEMLDLGGPTVSTLLSVEVEPHAILLGDMTNDSQDDAIVVRGSRRNLGLTIYSGASGGGFDPAPEATETQVCGDGIAEGTELCDDGNTAKKDGCSPSCQPEISRSVAFLEAHDFDADLNLDLLVIDKKNTMRILFGDGAGRFREVRTLGVTKRKSTAGVGDFTGDGLLDIAYMPKRKKDGAVLILVNDGIGGFTLVKPVLPVAKPKLSGPLIAADIDRNGFADLVLQSATKPTKGIAVLYSRADSPLGTMASTKTPRGATRFAAADFNEDGWLDIMVQFRSKRTSPLILFGSPGTALVTGPTIPTENARAPLTIADLDEDLHHDLVTCGDGGTCRILFGDGGGEFRSAPLPATPAIGREVRGAGVADFDEDGFVDLVGVSRRDSIGKIHFGGLSPSTLDLETGTKPSALKIADFNGDGLPDIVVGNEGSQDVSIFTNAGNRQFNTLARIKLPAGGSGPIGLDVADVNDDGTLDVGVSQAEDPRVTVLLNTVGAGFAAMVNFETGAGPRGVALANLNGDALLDIVTANRDADTISVFLSTPAGDYEPRADLPSGGAKPWDIVAIDMNDNGFDDLVVLNGRHAPTATEGSVVTFLNDADGTGSLTQSAPVVVHGRETPTTMCVGNFDGDGAHDIAIGGVGTHDISMLHGDGAGGWNGDRRCVPANQPVSTVSCNDADGDGLTDIAFGRRRGSDVGAILTGDLQ